MFPQVLGDNLKLLGLRDNFRMIYSQEEAEVDKRVNGYMDEFGSDAADSVYGMAESAAVAQVWTEGTAIPTTAFRTQNFRVPNYKFGVAIPVAKTTIEDDQIGLIMPRVMEAALSMARLKERHFFWALTGGAVSDAAQLQPTLNLAPDGVGLFSTLNGAGAARFGVTNGNAIPGNGVATAAAVQLDLATVYAQFAGMLGTNGQPLHSPGVINRALGCFFNSNNWGVFSAAVNQQFNVAASGNAAPSNVVIDAAWKLELLASPRITAAATWYAFIKDASFKSIFRQIREGASEILAETGNSDMAREFDVLKFYIRSREGYGISLPYNCVSVN